MTGFFERPPDWTEHWRGMPAFDQNDLTSLQAVEVQLASAHAREQLARLLDRNLTPDTRSIWYPRETIDRMMDKHWTSDRKVNPKYPVYIISKGRWESRLTVKALEKMGVPHRVVIEPQERDEYVRVMDEKKLLILPFSNLGKGSIPARNWVWKHSISEGHERHWILDDNISHFCRFQNNLKVPVSCGNIFRAAEDFVDRYENVALAGFQYFMFVSRKSLMPPYVLNTRIYSCILIKNDLPHHWRGRYNEDTDLSLRCLKDGWCTVLFNAFLALKQTTMTMKGGNTDELYQGDGRFDMAESLRLQHPDCVAVTRKWGRWQHSVDYSPFKRNKLKLKLKSGIGPDELPQTDEYGMELRMLEE